MSPIRTLSSSIKKVFLSQYNRANICEMKTQMQSLMCSHDLDIYGQIYIFTLIYRKFLDICIFETHLFNTDDITIALNLYNSP